MQGTTITPNPPVQPRKQHMFISLRLKLLVGFLLLFGVVLGASYYWFHTFSDDLVRHRFYDFTTDAAMDRLADDLSTVLEGIAGQIDGDEFQALIEEGVVREDGYTDDERYWTQAALLYQQRTIDPRSRLYTFVAGDGPNTVKFIGSSGALLDPPGGVTFGQEIAFSPADAAVILDGLKKTTLYLIPYEDEFGRWISGYTPITNAAGDKVGALGIDIRAEYVAQVQESLEKRIVEDVKEKVEQGIIVASGITAILVIISVYAISGLLTRPVIALTRTAARIGEGDYEQDLSYLTGVRFPDEIGALAQVFEIMVGKVHQREQKLKQQVSELQIIIDESKRQSQVEEIVESDFFRELQQKAKMMRDGFTSRQAPEELPSPADDAPGENPEA
ncbi:MAG: HAMP domain-containing protein [Anaerolineae bacterium]|nr:HAMP domain-containing protein [Anaerolineae bacterium]